MTIDKRLLRERNKMKHSRPKFRRQESWRFKRLNSSWRRVSGIDNKMRHHKRGWPKIVRNGYRGPKAVRGLTSNGKEEVLVHNIEEISQVNKDYQIARIASAVGVKKKINMTNKADELGIKIINRPEEALTFATISEISEELLLEDEDLAKGTKKATPAAAPRKKKPSASKDLTEKELEELEKIEAQLAGKTAKKTTTTPKTTTPKTTTKSTTTTPKKTTTTEKKPATSTTKKATTTTPKTTTPKKTTTTTEKSSTAKSTTSKTTTSKTTSSKKAADTTTKAASTKKKE